MCRRSVGVAWPGVQPLQRQALVIKQMAVSRPERQPDTLVEPMAVFAVGLDDNKVSRRDLYVDIGVTAEPFDDHDFAGDRPLARDAQMLGANAERQPCTRRRLGPCWYPCGFAAGKRRINSLKGQQSAERLGRKPIESSGSLGCRNPPGGARGCEPAGGAATHLG